MSVLRYLLPAAAAVAAVSAQCSADPTTTIQNAGDATGLASCTTFSGSIAIATNAPDTIALNGIEVIDGDLIVRNASQLTGISADQLTEITGTFELTDVQILTTLDFPSFKRVDIIRWIGLPGLQQLGFTNQLTEANNLTIENTQLNNLNGINLETVGGFRVVNNRFIRQMSLQLGNVSDALTVTDNSQALTIELPNLIWANNVDIANVSSLDISSLEAINSSLYLRGSSLETFSAPNLTSVEDSFTFSDNSRLTNISAPLLETINGGFKVSNNPELEQINGVPSLATVGGALDLSGNFTEVSLPALRQVRGTTNIQSSQDISESCAAIRSANNGEALQGDNPQCASNQETPGGEGTQATGTGANAGRPTGAATIIRSEMSAAILGFSGAAMYALL